MKCGPQEIWPPAGVTEVVSFAVSGEAKGAGSKKAIPLGRREGKRFKAFLRPDGMPMVNVVDDTGAAGKAWRKEVQAAAAHALGEAHKLVDGPIAVRLTFFHPRPQAHFGTGRNAGVLKDGVDRSPHRSELPDGTKLARAIEDALTAVAWTDDRRVCECWWSRKFGEDPGAVVDIYAMPYAMPAAEIAEDAGQLALT